MLNVVSCINVNYKIKEDVTSYHPTLLCVQSLRIDFVGDVRVNVNAV